jgi:hypothetical protein
MEDSTTSWHLEGNGDWKHHEGDVDIQHVLIANAKARRAARVV